MVKLHRLQILISFVPKDPLFNHCALPPHTKQLTFDYFFHLSVKNFKKWFENGLKGVNQLGVHSLFNTLYPSEQLRVKWTVVLGSKYFQ